MSKESIEVSKDSIKLSYEKYLSDSAPGFIIILSFILIHVYKGLESPLFSFSGFKEIDEKINFYVIVLLTLLATPVGIIINAIGYYLIGGKEYSLSNEWWDKKSYFTRGDSISWNLQDLTNFFHFEDKNKFSNFTYRLKSIFSVYGNYPFHEVAGVRGIRRFLRSTTIILPVISTYYMACLIYTDISKSSIGEWITFIIIALIIPLFLIRLSGLLKFYESCAYLERAFLICQFYGKAEDLKGKNVKILEFISTYLSENKSEVTEE